MFLGRVVGPGEPLFLPADTDGALALQKYEGLLCSGCGQPRDESMLPENEDAYHARLFACHACAEQQKAMEALQENEHSDPGIQVAVERR